MAKVLRQLHRECNSPVRFRPLCPIHGEVSQDELVTGYPIDGGQFVVVDPVMDQIRELRNSCVDRTEYERRLARMMDAYLAGCSAIEALDRALTDDAGSSGAAGMRAPLDVGERAAGEGCH